MMNSNILKKMRTLVVLFLVSFTFTAFAQDINQAGEIFNEGNQAVKDGDFVTAIQKYDESIKVASKLGAEGEQIVSGAKAQIPSLYYKIGAADYKEKNIEKAIDEFGKAIEYGNEYGDTETVEKSRQIIPKLYYAKGNDLYKEDKYNEALKAFEQSREMNPEYSRAFWGMGLAYSKLKNYDEMDNAFAGALKLAEKEGDEKMASKIRTTATQLLQAEGAAKLQSSDWSNALKYLNASLNYDANDKDTYYYLALGYNGNKSYDDALAAAQKGLELSNGENQEFKAKYYYEMGNAYKGKGMNTEACTAFTDASHGRFVESANYELKTVLKCN
jgi:tetratricopeptide (TPR) repeat protein